MTVVQHSIQINTRGKRLLNVTQEVQGIVSASSVRSGLCCVFVSHTSASLLIQENADPRVLDDLEAFFSDLVPESRRWSHDDEGPDDMPAHVRSALTKTSETIPVVEGRLQLGTWQGLYLWEHRSRAHARTLLVTVLGEGA